MHRQPEVEGHATFVRVDRVGIGELEVLQRRTDSDHRPERKRQRYPRLVPDAPPMPTLGSAE